MKHRAITLLGGSGDEEVGNLAPSLAASGEQALHLQCATHELLERASRRASDPMTFAEAREAVTAARPTLR